MCEEQIENKESQKKEIEKVNPEKKPEPIKETNLLKRQPTIPGYFIVPYQDTLENFAQAEPFFEFGFGHDALENKTKQSKSENLKNSNCVFVENFFFYNEEDDQVLRYKRRFRLSTNPKKFEIKSWDEKMDKVMVEHGKLRLFFEIIQIEDLC